MVADLRTNAEVVANLKLRFHQSLREISMAVHGAPKNNVPIKNFVKKYVLLERAKNEREAPITQARMRKPNRWANQWVMFDKRQEASTD
jgi:hypothetical protein